MTTQATVQRAFDALLVLFEEMVVDAEANPRKWDEDYSEHAVSDCLDRLWVSDPKPSVESRNRCRELNERAVPFLFEDDPT